MDSVCAFEKRKLQSKDDKESGKSISLFTSTIKTSSLIQFGTRTPTSAGNSNDEKLTQADMDIQKVGSPRPSISVKRSRTNLESLAPVCQVHGCNKDLGCSKDYHKRHKVCDIHSKTSVVVVSGIQQRFCQQCSRFHMVAEFDGSKRSCRKRLAGHNKRRRKPQLLTDFDSNLACRDFSSTSVLFPKTFPAGALFGQQYYEPTQVVPQSVVPMQFGFSLHLNSNFKQCPFDKYPMKAPLFIQNLYQSSNYGSALSLSSVKLRSRTYRAIHRLIFRSLKKKVYQISPKNSPLLEEDKRKCKVCEMFILEIFLFCCFSSNGLCTNIPVIISGCD